MEVTSLAGFVKAVERLVEEWDAERSRLVPPAMVPRPRKCFVVVGTGLVPAL